MLEPCLDDMASLSAAGPSPQLINLIPVYFIPPLPRFEFVLPSRFIFQFRFLLKVRLYFFSGRSSRRVPPVFNNGTSTPVHPVRFSTARPRERQPKEDNCNHNHYCRDHNGNCNFLVVCKVAFCFA